MGKICECLFSRIPHLEVLVRILYWKFAFINRLFVRFKNDKRSQAGLASAGGIEPLMDTLNAAGVQSGDILVVHSSMHELQRFDTPPSKIVERLLELVGESGSVVMPAFPKYREAKKGVARITDDLAGEVWTYDVQKTLPWTGALPFAMMRRKDSIRSQFPLNSIVVCGMHAQEMVARELEFDHSTPCGPNSAWAYCAARNAKVVALGVDFVHSLTMIHVAEDCNESRWPVRNWYRPRKFCVREHGIERVVSVRERHPRWAMHFAERKLGLDLRRNDLVSLAEVHGMEVAYIESQPLVSYLEARVDSAYPYYMCRLGGVVSNQGDV